MTPPTSRVVLHGRDHLVLGEIAVESPSAGVAVAISRGNEPKGYWHVDPNEDVAAACVGPRAMLLVCADGHRGKEASEEAVTSVLATIGDDPPPGDLADEALVQLFHQAGEAVLRRTKSPRFRNPDSRTTLTVALISDQRMQWASMGDAALFVASSSRAPRYGEAKGQFVGWPMTIDEVSERLPRGSVELGADEWVILATDGFTDFVKPQQPEQAVLDIISRATHPDAVARSLVQCAFEGGAGDNVAIVVAAPASQRGPGDTSEYGLDPLGRSER